MTRPLDRQGDFRQTLKPSRNDRGNDVQTLQKIVGFPVCGIGGVLRFADAADRPPAEMNGRLEAMNAIMAHRDPDGEGVWVHESGSIGLAHRRLAIVDLSADAAQPMADHTGDVRVTYNGEIYNHLDLRRELQGAGHRFFTDHSDTEVLVHGYKEWGLAGLVERLHGMFAFAIWDNKRQKLSLARDRIGIKPIYFTTVSGTFRFASEIKAVLIDPAIDRKVDPNALNHYLSFMVAPAPLTMFENVFKLPAAHIMEIGRDGRIEAQRYWDALPGNGIAAGEIAGMNDRERETFYIDGVRRRLEAAVDKRMMSDVPFGVFLSGGIDSSANVALMSRLTDRPVETFTVGFKDNDRLNELEYANRIAVEFKTNHHEVMIGEVDMLDYLERLVHSQDEPIADWVCVPLYFVSKLARDSGVTVVQVGEGSDEQFCGYDSWITYLRFFRSFWDPYHRLVPSGARRLAGRVAAAWAPDKRAVGAQLAEALSRAGTGTPLFISGANAFWNVHKSRYLEPVPCNSSSRWQALADAGLDLTGLADNDSGAVSAGYINTLRSNVPNVDRLNEMTYGEFRLRLPELLLMRVDKIGMSTSIEGRVPFLDHELVELTQDIPQTWKVRGGVKKYLLKKAVGDLLPEDIINRPKMGFAAPVAEWLRADFGRQAQESVLGSSLFETGLFDTAHIAEMFRQHRELKADHALHLWSLFNLAAWHDHWITG